MPLNLKKLTELLEMNDPKIMGLKNSILESFGNDKKMRGIIDRQCENREQTHCYACSREAGCLILNGIAYLELGEIDTAIKEIENANQHFRGEGESWNQIIGLALLGNAYEENRKDHQALREFEKAYHVITRNYLRIHSKDYIDKAISLEKMLKNQLENPDLNKKAKQTITSKSRLPMPWIPAYTGLQAGPNGPIWIELPLEGNGTSIDEIILDDKSHNIYSEKQGDKLIKITNEKKYAWAKVSGNSMNACKPVPISENDFVLFYKSEDADNNAIIIASYPEDSGSGNQYVVKRYAKNDKLLISETELPDNHPPMPVIKETSILGVVIAVAKPAK
jgi:tetratricopeptide (TPR) repeat protein